MRTERMIRPAGSEDIPAIAALERECFSDPWPADMLARMRERITVAADGAEVLGYLVLSRVLDEGNIDNVAVAPAHRRQGVADALIGAAVRHAREGDLSFLTLEVRASNTPAIALYEKHGFREVGRRRGYYEKPREDAILMTLDTFS